jgi:hypothetical protein
LQHLEHGAAAQDASQQPGKCHSQPSVPLCNSPAHIRAAPR